jgi:ADP-heptose:LPS heptosyltransferase
MKFKLSWLKNRIYPAVRELEALLDSCVSTAFRIFSKGPVSQFPRKILIAKLDSIGDFILFTAALPALREVFKGGHLVLLVKSNVYNLAETCPFVDDVWCLDQHRFRANILVRLKWLWRVYRFGFAIAVNATYSANFDFLEGLIACTNAHRRIGFEHIRSSEKSRTNNDPFYTELVADTMETLFEIDRMGLLLHNLGYRGKLPHETGVWVTRDDWHAISHMLDGRATRGYAVLFPGAQIAEKKWSPENFIQTALRVSREHSLAWIICGGEAEVEVAGCICDNLLSKSLEVIDLTGKTTLRQLACIIQEAVFSLTNDTSAAHISAAVGTPVISIVGGGHFGRFFPYPGNEKTIAVTNPLPCFNCNWLCTREEAECVSGVTVDNVVTAILRCLELHGNNGEMARRQPSKSMMRT